MTTHDLDSDRLAKHFARHYGCSPSTLNFGDRILCRRVEIHHLTAAELFRIVALLVEEGLKILAGISPDSTAWNDPSNPGRVRLVIDDWSTLRDSHPEVREDPLFLPFVLFYLRRRGVTVLLIDTQPGRLSHILSDESDRELRALVDHHVYTWYVTFFGEKRVAISALPPVDNTKRVVVRELAPAEGDNEALLVDPSFELYQGFEDDKAPTLVPLKVHLCRAEGATDAYHQEVFAVFRAVFGEDAKVEWNDGAKSPDGVPRADYDQLRSQTYLRGRSALEHTQVLQVDEFWSGEKDSGESETLEDLADYLEAPVVDAQGRPNLIEDPGRLFQPPRNRDSVPSERFTRFSTIGYNLGDFGAPRDRVPYFVDFGFLLAREDLWLRAIEKGGAASQKIATVWDSLAGYPKPTNHRDLASGIVTIVSWRDFLEACLAVVASSASPPGTTAPVAFDIDLTTIESLSCLALEILASELYTLGAGGADIFPRHRHDAIGPGLLDLAGSTDHTKPLATERRRAFYRAWLLLAAAFRSNERFTREGFELKPRPASPQAVACRHWYSTACPGFQPELTPIRLPGHFTVRGDWFLAVASGSRSRRLGERAIDILTSRRANISRMQLGIGLPTRGFDDRETATWEDVEFRSPLTFSFGLDGGRPRPGENSGRRRLLFHDVLRLGGQPSVPKVFLGQEPAFFWLWRSRLESYERHSRTWRKWLLYALDDSLNSSNNTEYPEFADLQGPEAFLALYDQDLSPGAVFEGPVVDGFERLRAILSVALERATFRIGERVGGK